MDQNEGFYLTTEHPLYIQENVLIIMSYLIFSIGYITLIGNMMVANGIRRTSLIKWFVFLMMGSQAYQVWSLTVSAVHRFLGIVFDVKNRLLECFLLVLLSLIPIIGFIFKCRRRRETYFSWRSYGQITELGRAGYYLFRPVTVSTEQDNSGVVRKTKSSQELRKISHNPACTHSPKSA